MQLSPRTRRVLRKTGKVGLGVLIGVVVLVLSGAGWVVWAVRAGFPPHTGNLTLEGLSAPVTVHRDNYGIPQLHAKTESDLFKAQGYVHAQDRFWEMDFRRHVTAGRVAELFGSGQLETDKYLRTMGWRRVAEQELGSLTPETRAALDAYAEGVNAWLKEHPGGDSLEYKLLSLQNAGYRIEQWTPVDSLAWLKAMAWDLRGNMRDEIGRQQLLALGMNQQQVDQLYPQYPYDRHATITGPAPGTTPPPAETPVPTATPTGLSILERDLAAIPALMGNADGDGIGSNSWVIAGSRTNTGKPLLANDPHLSPSQPGIWYQMGLHCECGLNVAGFTFSGVPGVVIGHNARIAWGFTNLGPDVIDMYVEDGTAAYTSREETIKVAGGDPVTITVRSTKHGPILSDVDEELKQSNPNQAIAMKWTALEPGKSADAITALNKAGNWEEFRAAAKLFDVPAQNMIYADVDGNIGYQTPGKIPVRGKGDGRYFTPGNDPAYDWTGYVPFEELPSVFNPPQGYIETANQPPAGADYKHLLTHDWSYGYRGQRIDDMITAHSGQFTLDDIQKMQMDSRNPFAPVLMPHLLRVSQHAADAVLKEWTSFDQTADSAGAAYYNAIWRHLMLLTFDELTSEFAPNGAERWWEVMRHLLVQPDSQWWDIKSTSTVEERDDVLAQAMNAAVKELEESQGDDPSEWRWGKMHTLTPTHATFGSSGIGAIEWLFNRRAVETSGGPSIVNATGWDAATGYEVDAVPSMRMIVDMSNLDNSRWIQLTGNSGHPFHDNYADQLELWRTGQLLPFRFDKATIEQENKKVLTLRP